MSIALSDWDVAEEQTAERRTDFRRAKMPTGSGNASRFSKRRPKSPRQMSGLHRRRRKKIQW